MKGLTDSCVYWFILTLCFHSLSKPYVSIHLYFFAGSNSNSKIRTEKRFRITSKCEYNMLEVNTC